jgi:hypothetical protein
MIIKLPNADFSANNIGQIDLRTEVLPSTQAVLDIYGKTWTLQEQFLIEDFLVAKNQLSFSAKIKELVLPILANPKASIADDAQNEPAFYGLISESFLPLTYNVQYDGSFYVDANGLRRHPNSGALNNLSMSFNSGVTLPLDNITVGAYWNKANTDPDIVIEAVSKIYIQKTEIQLGLLTGQKVECKFDQNIYYTKGSRVISYNGTTANGLGVNLPLASLNKDDGDGLPTISAPLEFTPLGRTTNDTPNTTLSGFFIGEYLTQAELTEFNTLFTNLIEGLYTD